MSLAAAVQATNFYQAADSPLRIQRFAAALALAQTGVTLDSEPP
ncbi:hypothetical protein [Saccharothrix stipae]